MKLIKKKVGLFMADNNIYDVLMSQVANDVMLQSRMANTAFISTMSTSNNVHARCGQVIDKRVAEFDIEENRAYSSLDPSSQSFWLAKSNQDNGSGHVSAAQLLEVLRQSQYNR